MTRPDYIVVGAGSAGCLVANRLSAITGRRVLVVEPESGMAPAADRTRPSRWLKLIGSAEDWNLKTEPAAGIAGRSIGWPRGRGLGGSSRINAMIWFPPTRRDHQCWIDASGGTWNADQIDKAYRSVRSIVRPESPRWLSDSSQRFIESAQRVRGGKPMIYQRANRRGRRFDLGGLLSSCEVTRATVDRVLWNGHRATGIRVATSTGLVDLQAAKGVVLCGGAIATPTILMRSGIGCADSLSRQGIDVRIDRPLVGRLVKDHLVMPVIFCTNAKEPFRVDPSTRDLARWQATGTGPVASNIAECGGLFPLGQEMGAVQIHVTPTHYLTFPKPSQVPSMTIAVNLTRPQSSGSIELKSANPFEAPRIETGYLSIPEDAGALCRAVELARRIARTGPLGESIGAEILPGSKRCDERSVTKSIARFSQTLYHPTGSCGFGDRPHSAVTPEFRVRGADGLWAVDASIFPDITTGNPAAAVMTLAMMASSEIAREGC